MTSHAWREIVLAAAVLIGGISSVSAQPQRPLTGPPPAGKRIEAQDGDTIVIRDGGRVRVVRRAEGTVRAIYNADGHWLVLLVDYLDPAKGAPDGIVDWTYRFNNVDGAWPLGERWEGSAVIDNYGMFNGPNSGVGLTTNAGFVQVFGVPIGGEWFRDSRAVALTYRGGGNGMNRGTFAATEQRAVEEAARNVESNDGNMSVSRRTLPNGSVVTSGVQMSIGARPSGEAVPSAPVRVGGNIKVPAKIVNVAPVMPEVARQAGVSGVVILEATVGTDGAIAEARVLRSIPLLDQAALDAVRQWRFEPTLLNGAPVPVIMTVTVNFTQQ
jgi:TonB family protein